MLYYLNAGELIRSARLDAGLDQATLAFRAGTSQTYVSRVERGKISPSVDSLARLSHAMGLSLTLDVEPLSPGNASIRELRADFVELTAEERVQQAFELSEFLTALAVQAET